MKNLYDILILLIAVVLPIGLGYFFRNIKLFDEKESNTLRKFVIRVSVPFLIFKNLYKANIESLAQFFPAATGFILLTLLFTGVSFFLSRRISGELKKQNAFAYSAFIGNYAFLGWGVVYSFYGSDALTRAVFFCICFWPVFLFCGFWMLHRGKGGVTEQMPSFAKVLMKNASVPVLTAAFSIGMNLVKVPVPGILWDFVEKFAGFSIPMILFTIGLNFKMLVPRSKLKVLIGAVLTRLVLGFALGVAVVFLVPLLFKLDPLTRKVILIESIMPTATMTVFFTEYAKIDKELHAGIIAFSTLFSLATIPFWYAVVERFF